MKYLAVAVVAFLLGGVAGLSIPAGKQRFDEPVPVPPENLQSPPETKMPRTPLEELPPEELRGIIDQLRRENAAHGRLNAVLREKLHAYESLRPQRG